MIFKYSFSLGQSRRNLPPQIVPIFPAKIADFGLKYCILKENVKGSTSVMFVASLYTCGQ
jgi:hypothetical protein